MFINTNKDFPVVIDPHCIPTTEGQGECGEQRKEEEGDGTADSIWELNMLIREGAYFCTSYFNTIMLPSG